MIFETKAKWLCLLWLTIIGYCIIMSIRELYTYYVTTYICHNRINRWHNCSSIGRRSLIFRKSESKQVFLAFPPIFWDNAFFKDIGEKNENYYRLFSGDVNYYSGNRNYHQQKYTTIKKIKISAWIYNLKFWNILCRNITPS